MVTHGTVVAGRYKGTEWQEGACREQKVGPVWWVAKCIPPSFCLQQAWWQQVPVPHSIHPSPPGVSPSSRCGVRWGWQAGSGNKW